MFDSLQYNYIGAYGNTWIKTPNMDRLAEEGILFENNYTEGLPTVPCRRAMHTGRYTLPFSGWTALSPEDTTIADLCWGKPVDTALIFDCPNYRLPKFGYARGFDKTWFTHGHEADEAYYSTDPLLHYKVEDYYEQSTYDNYRKRFGDAVTSVNLQEIENFLKVRENSTTERHVVRTMDKAIEYLEQVDRRKQFFLWIDSFDPHEPWDAPSVYDPEKKCPYDPDYTGKDAFLPFPDLVEGVYSEAELHHVRMLYAEIVTLCDECLGKLMKALQRLGLEDNTLLWMVSDHGEPFGEGEHGHGIIRKCRPWPYDEVAHAPMIMRVPGAKPGQRIKAFVQSVDVAPTICDWLGIGIHPAMQGKSLLPLVFGEVDKVRDFAIAGYYPYSWSIITEDWTYIHWNKNSRNNVGLLEMCKFYGDGVDSSHLNASRKEGEAGNVDMRVQYVEALSANKAKTGLGTNATLDGEAQWSCTPTATADVPEEDELYDRKKDPHQLVNLIHQYPDVAQKLLKQLTLYMEELQAS